jgi:monothiol glutaredoxin
MQNNLEKNTKINDLIEKEISENKIVLFMKGTKHMPQCGFSATVVQILMQCSVEDFRDINILEDPEMRQGIKDFSNWPTIPQLYINKEFIGGCDIIREMFESGELITLINNS